MENLKLNETPVRTAKNFRINNIKLENIEIPEVIPEFENVTITGDTSKIDIEQNADNIDINLAYGLSEELAVQVKAQANQKIKLNIKDTQNEKSKTENLENAPPEIISINPAIPLFEFIASFNVILFTPGTVI